MLVIVDVLCICRYLIFLENDFKMDTSLSRAEITVSSKDSSDCVVYVVVGSTDNSSGHAGEWY